MTAEHAGRSMAYDGDRRAALAMPLGGIGTGQLAICGDGSLRQWQLHNIGNHLGYLPGSFFALRVSRPEPPLDELRLLQSAPVDPVPGPAPLVSDHVVPAELTKLTQILRPVDRTTFRGLYPFGEVDFHDDDLPVSVTMEAFTPLVPLDVAASALPAALFTFTLRNDDAHELHGSLGATLQNAVGWDGITPIVDNRCASYGGNVNRARRRGGWTSLLMDNPSLADDDPGFGQMVLSADTTDADVYPQWSTAADFATFLRGGSVRSGPRPAVGPSAPGATWNGGLRIPFRLGPGETVAIRVVLSWYFPNRYVNFDQFGPAQADSRSRLWLGNDYATHFADAEDVAETVRTDWHRLRDRSRDWMGVLSASSLPDDVVERMAAQLSLLRSPTCFHTADGRFFGFEGTLGASTAMWNGDYGGSCPLNCTHVWNYAQAVSRLFPELERSMRETELEIMQAPEGYIPHRAVAPVYLRQMWDVPIGGPTGPALDGMLGTVLKTYREVRAGAGLPWLERMWPRIMRLLDHIGGTWDPDRTGVLRGIQPSTHDIDLCGVNTFMGSYWLAALRAAEEMARLLGDDEAAAGYHSLFRAGSTAYDELTWTGEYYRQLLDPAEPTAYQWGEGCLSDQLVGQWWAHQLELGYILPVDHVRTALRSIVRHNLREGFRGFDHPYRVYADGDDRGLLICSWPTGGRPDIPTRYADEVWSGVEYQVAAHCLDEGLQDEGMRILRGLWARHDGTRRNPYNEIECGDHYVRAMAGWSVLESLTGLRWNAVARSLRLHPIGAEADWRVPVLTDTGWGTASADAHGLTLTCLHGTVGVRELRVAGDWTSSSVTVGTEKVDHRRGMDGDETRLFFEPDLVVAPGAPLVVGRD